MNFFKNLIVALKKRERELQLQKSDDEEKTLSNALSAQIDSMESDNSSVSAPKIDQHSQKCEDKENTSTNILKIFEKTTAKKERAKTEKRPPNQIRFSSGNHSAETGDRRIRCKMEKCPYKSNVKCVKCNVHLCVNKRNCFADFHNIDTS